MLGHSAETPRPRPPPRARRSTSNLKTSSPPPAYAPSFTFPSEETKAVLGSPLAATFQKFNWDSAGEPFLPESDNEWMNEKSQEELAELLSKAGGLIKEREGELNLTTSICRDLYESNVALKSKHQALLARLPLSQESSPSFLASPTQLDGRGYIDSGDMGHHKPSRPSKLRRHARTISMTTNDISMLADQNAELLQKLEKLEQESTRTDQTSRRELRRLEKEISYLKDELEKSQARDEELGKRAEKAVEEAWMKKKARVTKLSVMRNLGRDFHSDSNHEVKNFAPEGSGFGGPSEGLSFFPSDDSFQNPPQSAAALRSRDSSSPSEKELISQLLAKMKELESTNARILEQQTRTADQLQAVHRETEQITKVYECLADPEQVQLELETPQKERKGLPLQEEAIRFRSFRKNLENELDSSMSTVTRRNLQRRDVSGPPRLRKSVIDLFDTVKPEIDLTLVNTPEAGTSKPSTPFPAGHIKHGSFSLAGGNSEAPSPTLSTLNFFSPPRSRPTLESELGSEFTESWGAHAGNYHLRTTSLTDFSHFAPISPSPVDLPQMDALGLTQAAGKEVDSSTASGARGDSRLAIETAYDVFTAPGSSGPKSPRYQRMAETVRSRTGRWADGRFKDTLSGRTKLERIDDRHNSEVESPDSHSKGLYGVIPGPLASAVDNMVESITRHAASDKSNPATLVSSPESSPKDDKAVQLRSDRQSLEKRRHGIGAIILEIWLWLQFVIIIFVFVWAMAKRGPKSVFRDVEKRSMSKKS